MVPPESPKERNLNEGACVLFLISCSFFLLTLPCVLAQSTSSSEPSGSVTKNTSDDTDRAGRIGAAGKVSTYGGGAEVAVSVTRRSNLRAGFNIITYDRGFDKDGIHYSGRLDMKTFGAHYDFFPWAKSFHISGGVLVYATDPITASAVVPGNQSYTFGGVTYSSDPATPTNASAKIVFNRAAPTVTFGFGNIVPRKHGNHFSVPVEFGVAFQGSPKTTLAVSGNICDAPGVNCRNAFKDANVQSNVISEQNKINNDISFLKVYPIISVGVGYKF